MKGKLSKLLICIGLVCPVLFACGNSAKPSDSSNSTTSESTPGGTSESTPGGTSESTPGGTSESTPGGTSESTPGGTSESTPSGTSESEPGETSESFEDNTGIPDYEGDTSREVGYIENVPVEAYSDELIAKAKRVLAKISSSTDFADTFLSYMLELKVGEELASAFFDFYDSTTSMTSSIETYASDEFVDVYYGALKLINSFDLHNLVPLLQRINREYRAEYQARYDSMTMESWYNPTVNGLDYSEYQMIMDINEEVKDPLITENLAGFPAAYADYYYSEASIARFESQKASYKNIAENGYIIPECVIDFVDSHADIAKELLVKDCKLLVDAYATIAADLMQILSTNLTNDSLDFRTEYEYEVEGYDYTYHGYQYFERDNSKMISEIINLLFEHKTTFLGVLKAILMDAKFGDFVLDALIDVALPLIVGSREFDDEEAAKYDRFVARVESLSGNHIAALASFLLRIANQAEAEDVIKLILSSDGDFDLASLGDKYLAKVNDIIASLTANEKSLILEFMRIFGIDVFDEIATLTAIFATKDVTTEDGAIAFQRALDEWWNTLYEKMDDALFSIFGAKGHQGSEVKPSEEVTDLFVQVDKVVYQGDTLTGEDFWIRYQDYNTGAYLSAAGVTSWNEQISQYQAELDAMDDEARERDPDRVARLEVFVTLTITEFKVEINTSKVGNVPCTVILVIKGEIRTFGSTVDVKVKDLVNVLRPTIYYEGTSKYRLNSSKELWPDYVFTKGQEAHYQEYDYDIGEYVNVTVDTSKAGWNVFARLQRRDDGNILYVAVYYVADPEIMEAHLTRSDTAIGCYIVGENYFNNTPSYDNYYSVDGMEFFSYGYLDFDASYVANKKAGDLVKVTADGVDYQFVVVDETNLVVTSRRIILNEKLSEDIVDPVTKDATLYEYHAYEVKVGDTTYRYSTNVAAEPRKVELTNFTYINGVAKFTYAGNQYSFTYDYSY